ncbi:MAG: cytochrome c peroxidase, partial [Bacteriovorax sp.]|nr:cytochrome c peroxidase [Bacteriovorax sp.]
QKIKFFKIIPLQPVSKNPNRAQYELGKRLFMETELSGNRNISCLTCHNPLLGTSDNSPLSRTEDGQGILRRNSQSLFNLANHSFMFWDGRVHYDSYNKIFTTPGPNLPVSIASVMTSALSAQALFPLINHDEMSGKIGENEIADAQNNIDAWSLIVTRLKKLESPNRRFKSYLQLFAEAYPQTTIEQINIGHVAEAIGAFEKEKFQSTGSPFYRYLNGEQDALSSQQKRGFKIFVDEGKCIACHQGGELGNNTFFASVGIPQWGQDPVLADAGRGEVNHEEFRKYFFKTPSLLNIGLTAPYMHNGAFINLREVINHYSNIKSSLYNYQIPLERKKSMPVAVEVLKNPAELEAIWKSIAAPFLKTGLLLSESDKDDLEVFLKEALTDPLWIVK